MSCEVLNESQGHTGHWYFCEMYVQNYVRSYVYTHWKHVLSFSITKELEKPSDKAVYSPVSAGCKLSIATWWMHINIQSYQRDVKSTGTHWAYRKNRQYNPPCGLSTDNELWGYKQKAKTTPSYPAPRKYMGSEFTFTKIESLPIFGEKLHYTGG